MAQKNNSKSVNGNPGKAVGAIIGIGALAALSAGAYFLYGTKEGAQKRVKIKGWMLKAKGEILEKMETMKDMNEENYHTIVDTVMKKYSGLKNMDKSEVDAMFADVKKHWKNIQRHVAEAKKAQMPAIKKAPAKKKVVSKEK